MIRGMGLIAHIQCMHIVGGTTPLGMCTLFSMVLVEKRGDTFVLIRYLVMGEYIVDPITGRV